jgi:hypothetical protein
MKIPKYALDKKLNNKLHTRLLKEIKEGAL